MENDTLQIAKANNHKKPLTPRENVQADIRLRTIANRSVNGSVT